MRGISGRRDENVRELQSRSNYFQPFPSTLLPSILPIHVLLSLSSAFLLPMSSLTWYKEIQNPFGQRRDFLKIEIDSTWYANRYKIHGSEIASLYILHTVKGSSLKPHGAELRRHNSIKPLCTTSNPVQLAGSFPVPVYLLFFYAIGVNLLQMQVDETRYIFSESCWPNSIFSPAKLPHWIWNKIGNYGVKVFSSTELLKYWTRNLINCDRNHSAQKKRAILFTRFMVLINYSCLS